MTKTGKHGKGAGIKKMAFNGLARALGGVPLTAMEKFARRKGREHERVIEKIKTQYW